MQNKSLSPHGLSLGSLSVLNTTTSDSADIIPGRPPTAIHCTVYNPMPDPDICQLNPDVGNGHSEFTFFYAFFAPHVLAP